MTQLTHLLLASVCLFPLAASAQQGWAHSGELTILTTPESANIPTGVADEDFPLLVRLHKDRFDLKQAKPDGTDVRFASSEIS